MTCVGRHTLLASRHHLTSAVAAMYCYHCYTTQVSLINLKLLPPCLFGFLIIIWSEYVFTQLNTVEQILSTNLPGEFEHKVQLKSQYSQPILIILTFPLHWASFCIHKYQNWLCMQQWGIFVRSMGFEVAQPIESC